MPLIQNHHTTVGNTIPHGMVECLVLVRHSTRPHQRVRVIGLRSSIAEQVRHVLAMQQDPLDTPFDIVSIIENQ